MKLVGFINTVSKSGNQGVTVCAQGEWNEWELANREPVGVKTISTYVSGKHLQEADLGKEITFFYNKTRDGESYCSGFKLA